MLRYYFDCKQKNNRKCKKQIEERQYEQNLKERSFKNITKIVYVFKDKEVKMEMV